MRTKLMASVAVALMGMGVTAFASPTPYQAVIDGAFVMAQGDILVADDPNNLGNFDQDRYIDATTNGSFFDTYRGSELAGLVWAQQIGAGSGTVQTYINNVSANIITESAGLFTGDELWGLTKASQIGVAGTGTAVTTYYNSTVTGTAAILAKSNDVIDQGGGNIASAAAIDGTGIWNLSHHVLASNTIGTTSTADKADWRNNLLTALGNYDTDRSEENGTTTTQALAVALWALRTTDTTGTTAGTDTNNGSTEFAGKTLSDLKLLLTTDRSVGGLYDVNTNTYWGGFTGTDNGGAEDIAYAILALKAFNDVGDTALIQSLEAQLAAAINATDGTPFDVNTASGYAAQYSGAALQALPEPAALSLLALGGLGLLARRRRQA